MFESVKLFCAVLMVRLKTVARPSGKRESQGQNMRRIVSAPCDAIQGGQKLFADNTSLQMMDFRMDKSCLQAKLTCK